MNFEYPTLANERYEIHQCIGKGGMAAVFKCFDRSLKTERAIKVLRPEFVARQAVRARFTTEAVAMANLSHPNIVHVYDYGLEQLTAFLVMEYLPYGSLQSYLDKSGPLSKPQAIAVCLDIARALSMAHQQGIIHRDIKPDNILLSSRGAKLSDFGLARMDDDDRNKLLHGLTQAQLMDVAKACNRFPCISLEYKVQDESNLKTFRSNTPSCKFPPRARPEASKFAKNHTDHQFCNSGT